ncbi:MAG TPA: metallophosphoesterase [Polyangiaceae bacterium]|jgi:hypothetical protein
MFHLVSIPLYVGLLGILWLWATRSFPALARRKRSLALALAALVLAQQASRFAVVTWHVGATIETALIVVLLTLCFAAVPIGVVRLVSWIAGVVARRARPSGASPSAATSMTRRQVIEATSGVALLGATGSALGWGMVRGRHAFEVDEISVRIAGLPKALDGYVIAQISDVHTGIHVGEREIDEGLERVRRAKPDMLVVTGDMVDFDAEWAPLIASKLRGVAPRDGVFACLGNHDYYAGVDRVLEVMHAAGVRVLANEGLLVRPGDGGGFALLGVEDRWSKRYRRPGARLDLATAMVPSSAPRILLSHQPPTVDRWAGQVALQLSGHTHGGQINPGFRPADILFEYVAGPYRVKDTLLYVNRGFGTVGPPSRVGAPPEVTRIVLVSA